MRGMMVFRIWKQVFGICLLLIGGFAPSGWAQSTADPDERKTIAIIRDGESWFLDWLVENFQKELTPIVSDRYQMVFEDSYDGGWNPEQTRNALSDALADPVPGKERIVRQ